MYFGRLLLVSSFGRLLVNWLQIGIHSVLSLARLVVLCFLHNQSLLIQRLGPNWSDGLVSRDPSSIIAFIRIFLSFVCICPYSQLSFISNGLYLLYGRRICYEA